MLKLQHASANESNAGNSQNAQPAAADNKAHSKGSRDAATATTTKQQRSSHLSTSLTPQGMPPGVMVSQTGITM